MLKPKMIGLTMAFGGVMGFAFALSKTENLFSFWNFFVAFLAAIASFLIVYFFYKYFM